MPTIKSSTDLRNGYNEISNFCHTHHEPVFITKNGRGDLAVMSIEEYESLCGKRDLYWLLDEGRRAVLEGRVYPAEEAFDEIEKKILDGTI
jgi:prevent-host-death family protein